MSTSERAKDLRIKHLAAWIGGLENGAASGILLPDDMSPIDLVNFKATVQLSALQNGNQVVFGDGDWGSPLSSGSFYITKK